MSAMSITAVIEAGKITESDDYVSVIQGLDPDQATGIAKWLCHATGGNVVVRFIDFDDAGFITMNYADEVASLERVREEAKQP